MNKPTSINFPCVMLEKIQGEHITVKSLTKFTIVNSQDEINQRSRFFNEPVICHYYSIVNEAKRINKMVEVTFYRNSN